jgi:radical SAM protein with 4Fe4S-binding SPASM domain
VHQHPQGIEIEINSHCNMACDYCPNSIDSRIEQGEIEFDLYLKIMNQLKEKNYKGQISFSFYNEPLLCTNFNKIIEATHKYLPDCFMTLYTNGTLINSQKRAIELINLGIGEIIVTKHEDVKNFKFENVYHELPDKFKIKYTLKSHTDLKLTNRGGSLKHLGLRASGNIPCRIPYIMMTVTIKGNVLSCFEDYKQENIMGNVKDENILDIWNNKSFSKFRKNLLAGKRHLYNICKNCNRIDEDLQEENEINLKYKEKHFLGSEEINAVTKIIESGKLFRYQSTAGECSLAEKEFADKIDSKYALMVTSGTNALVISLAAAGIGPGDEVLIPAYTFVATAAAVVQVGAIPIVVNIDNNFGICLREIKEKVTNKTKAIIPVHMDGLCCDIEEIVMFAKNNNLVVIEDVCQAMGGKFKGKSLGTFGDFGCFSLNMDKILTSGEGGIIITNKKENYEKICSLSDSAFSFSPHHKDFFQEINPTLGFSSRVSEITGVIFREQIKKLDKILLEYRVRKEILVEIINGVDQFETFLGHDSVGECHISLHLRFKDAEASAIAGKKLRNYKIMASPVSMRPGHVVWKWSKILGERSHINNKLNPYLLSDKKYTYPVSDFLVSMDIIMCTLKLDINVNWSLEETKTIGEKIVAATTS